MENIEPRDGDEVSTSKSQVHIKFILIISAIIIVLVIVVAAIAYFSNKPTAKKPEQSDTSSVTQPATVDVGELKRKRQERRDKLAKMNKNIETEEQSESNLQDTDEQHPEPTPKPASKPTSKPKSEPEPTPEPTIDESVNAHDSDDDAPVLHDTLPSDTQNNNDTMPVIDNTKEDDDNDDEELLNNFMANNIQEDSE